MTLASVGQPILWPPFHGSGAAPAYAQMLTDAVGEKGAFLLRAPKTGSIRYVHWLPQTIASGDPSIDVRIETVDQTVQPATPSGTLFGTNTNCSYNISSGDDNVWQRKQLTADCSVTKGDALAIVIVNNDGAAVNIQRANTSATKRFPYCSHYTASWAASTQSPVLALEYSDGTFEPTPGVWGMSAISNDSSTSSTLNRGMKLTIPFKCRVMGMWAVWERVTASGTVTGKLFGTDGTTVLLSKAWDTDFNSQTSASYAEYPFDSTTTLSAGSTYWLTGVADGTTSLRIYYSTYNSTSGLYAAMAPGNGAAVWSQATSPASTSDWTDTSLRLPWMGLMIDQLDDGAGASGGVTGPTMVIGSEGVFAQ